MDITWIHSINCNLSMRNNNVRKKIFCQIPVFVLILAISVPMVTFPLMSNSLFFPPNMSVNQLVYAEGGDSSGGDSSGGDSSGGDSSGGDSSGGDSSGGDSSGGDSSGGDSSGGDQSTSSTTTDPALASSTTTDPALASSTTTDPALASSTTTDPALASSTTTDPALASSTTTDPALASSTTTDPALEQSLTGLTVTKKNTNPSLVEETAEQGLNCRNVSEKNFKVSSNDPNGFDGDNDGIGCESIGEGNKDGNNGISPISVTNIGPDNDCLLNPDLPKCASVDGECPDGFFQNEDEQCVPEGGCPNDYHTVDDDETGRCIPDSDGCPEGMIFRFDGKTCGDKDQLCQDNSDLEDCVETPGKCDASYPNHCIKPSETDLDCNWNGNVKPESNSR